MPLSGAGRLGHALLGMPSVVGMAGSPDMPTHQLVQQPGLVGGYLSFERRRALRSDKGFCFGAASTADQPLAETFFNLRANPNPRLTSVGSAFWGAYVADKSFEGAENHRRWLDH
jgi:hypothetical protein